MRYIASIIFNRVYNNIRPIFQNYEDATFIEQRITESMACLPLGWWIQKEFEFLKLEF